MPASTPTMVILILISIISAAVLVLSTLILIKMMDHKNSSASAGWQEASHMLLSSMNRSVNPCHDFYSYACGNWIQSSEDDTSWFTMTQEKVNKDTVAAIRSIDNSIGSNDARTLKSLKTLFIGCENAVYDTGARWRKMLEIMNEYGGWPILKSEWSWTKDVPVKFQDFSYTIGWMFSRYQIPTFLFPNIRSIPGNNPSQFILDGPALTMAYCNRDPTDFSWIYLRKFMLNITSVLAEEWRVNVDEKNVLFDIERMIELEQWLCNISGTEFLTPTNAWNAEIRWPNVNWTSYFHALMIDIFGYETISRKVRQNFYVLSPDYMHALDRYIFPKYLRDDSHKRILQNYMLWRVIAEYIQFTGPLFRHQWNDFVKQTRIMKAAYKNGLGLLGLSKSKKYSDRNYGLSEEACLELANEAAIFAVGRAYTDFVFKNRTSVIRNQMYEIIRAIMHEFKNMLNRLTWMDIQSRDSAMEKIDHIIVNVMNQDFAFDDQKLDEHYRYLSELIIDPQYADLFDTLMAVGQYQLSILFKALISDGTDRYSWGEDEFDAIGPVIVNAWYQFSRNSITIPAGIVRAPFYHHDFPYAMNFGALASIIGHELIHGFDLRGQEYDQFGNEGSWISKNSRIQFQNMSPCIDEKFGRFCYDIRNQSVCVNSDRTEEENLADSGGIKAAYGAYVATRPSTDEPSIFGLEHLDMEQIFFLSYAHQWCEKMSLDNLVTQLDYATHSPSKDRVIGTLQNFPPFSRAWKCSEGDYMYSKENCAIW